MIPFVADLCKILPFTIFVMYLSWKRKQTFIRFIQGYTFHPEKEHVENLR